MEQNNYQEIVQLLNKVPIKKKDQTDVPKEAKGSQQLIDKLQEENKTLSAKNAQLEERIKTLEKAKSVDQSNSRELKLKLAESIWLYQNQNKSTEICFIGDDDEKFHKYIEKVGEGATSITYKVIDTRTDTVMCKKVLKVDPKNPPSIKDVKNIIKEFEILVRIDHPCICNALFINTQETVIDANISDSNNTTIAIFLEFLEFDLKKELKSLNNTLKTRIVVEVCHALNYLHKNKMIHRDLKIENIMLNSVYQAKLVDFGLILCFC